MLRNARKLSWIAVIGLMAAGAGACGGDAEVDRDAVDREMDLALEGEAEPELQDVPDGTADETPATPPAAPPPAATPRPSPPPAATPQPTPPPAPPAASTDPDPDPEPQGPAMITLTAPAATAFRVEMRQEISTKTNSVGDRFTAVLREPIYAGNRVLAPSGATVRGEVTALQKSGGQGEEAVIKLVFNEIMVNGVYFPLDATITDAQVQTRDRMSTGDRAARTGAGAVAGAILGRVIGGNTRGAVIGGVVGAAAGTAITLITEDVDAVLPAGSTLDLVLDTPLVITIEDPDAT